MPQNKYGIINVHVLFSLSIRFPMISIKSFLSFLLRQNAIETIRHTQYEVSVDFCALPQNL